MDRPMKVSEFVITVAGFIIALAVMLYNRGTAEGRALEKQAVFEMRLRELKDYADKNESDKKELMSKLDEQNEKINRLLIQLENKKNRE